MLPYMRATLALNGLIEKYKSNPQLSCYDFYGDGWKLRKECEECLDLKVCSNLKNHEPKFLYK